MGMGITTLDMAKVTVMGIITSTHTIMVIIMMMTTRMTPTTDTGTIITMVTTMIMRTRILTIITGTHTTIPTHTIMGIPIPTGTIITAIRTGKTAKSSWSRISSPTTTSWPSATAVISRRRISLH